MDAETQKAHTAWGSFADPESIQSGALAPMRGKFAYIWTGAVLHVLTKDDVRAFLTHAHAMLAPNGTFFGVGLHFLTLMADMQLLQNWVKVYLRLASDGLYAGVTMCSVNKSCTLQTSFACCPLPSRRISLSCRKQSKKQLP